MRIRKTLMLLSALIAAGLSATPGTQAQSPAPARRLAFEVASIKQNRFQDFTGSELRFFPGGRFAAKNLLLVYLIADAYDLPFLTTRLTGGPNWIRTDRFDIEATAPGGAIPDSASARARDEAERQMIRALLADRFKLIVRRETKSVPVFALVVDTNGPKLQRAKVDEKDCAATVWGFAAAKTPADTVSCHTFVGGQAQPMFGEAVEMSDLARYVENWAGRPVVDQTRLTGLFRVETTTWLPIRPDAPPEERGENRPNVDSRPSFFAVFGQLGLRLKSERAAIETFVIEHIERPAEN